MQLYLDSYGTYLGVKNGLFWVRPKGQPPLTFPVRDISIICMTKGVSISTNAMLLALESNIPLLVLDAIEFPVAQIWSGQYGSIATIRKRQAQFCETTAGLSWITKILYTKTANQAFILEKYAQDTNELYTRSKKVLQATQQRFLDWQPNESQTTDQTKAMFRGWEGIASRQYFKTISAILPPNFQFPKRSKRPAYTRFNALLNYLYGILYRMVHLALLKAGIDPFMGILHTDRHKQPTMVFDVIEQYRYWVDETAIRLCQEQRLSDESFEIYQRNGYWLTKQGKPIATTAFFEHMHTKILHNGNLRKRISHLEIDAAKFATLLKNYQL